jgi:hypothetical protein
MNFEPFVSKEIAGAFADKRPRFSMNVIGWTVTV